MAQLSNWIRIGEQAADLASITPQLEAVAELAEHWKEVAAGLRGLFGEADLSSPEAVLTFLAGALDEAAVETLFGDLDLAPLHAKLRAVRGDLRDPNAPWSALIRPASAFGEVYRGTSDACGGFDEGDGEPAIRLAAKAGLPGAQGGVGPASVAVALSAEGGLGIEPGALWPFPRDGVAGGLVSVALAGRLSAGTAASLPFGSAGTGAVQADGAVAASVALYYRPDHPDRAVGSTLLRALPALPNPFELDELEAAVNSAGLSGLVMQFDGEARAGLSLALGKNFDIPELFQAAAGLSAALSFGRRAKWLLSLRATDEGALCFVLSREISRSSEWAAGIGVTVDAAALLGRVHAVLHDATGDWGELLDQVKPYLDPGAFARGHLIPEFEAAVDKLVADPALRAALKADAGLLAGSGDSSAQLAEAVGAKLAQALSTAGSGLIEDGAAAAARATESIVAAVPAFAAAPLRDLIEGEVKSLLAAVRGKFDAKLAELTSTDQASKALAKELDKAGVELAEGLDRATAARDGVRRLADGYDRFAKKLLARVAEAATAKLGARFGADGGKTRGEHYELIGAFTDAGPSARALWRALARGDLRPFQALLSDPAGVVPGVVLDPASTLARFAGRHHGFALEIVVMGIELSLETVIRSEAEITLGAGGDVLVHARGEAGKTLKSFKERRSATFVSSWDLVLGRLSGDRGGRIGVALQLDHSDKSLKDDEVAGLLEGLAECGLIQPARVALARAERQKWKLEQAAAGKKAAGTIAIRLTLPEGAGARLVETGRGLRAGSPGLAAATFAQAIAAMRLTGVASDKRIARDSDDARRGFPQLAHEADPARIMYALRDAKLDAGGTANAPRFNAYRRLIRPARAYLSLLERMAEIHDASPLGWGPPTPGQWSEKDYRRAEEHLAEDASKWLKLNAEFLGVIFGAEDAMHPVTVAFLVLLAGMALPRLDDVPPASGALPALDPVQADPLFAITMTPRQGAAVSI